ERPFDGGDGKSQQGKVTVDRPSDDVDVALEVTVRQTVSHLSDLAPRDCWTEPLRPLTQRLTRLADLDQTHPNGAEHRLVLQRTTQRLRLVRGDGSGGEPEKAGVTPAQRRPLPAAPRP